MRKATVILVLVILGSCTGQKKYVPLLLNANVIEERPFAMTPQHKINIIKVFRHYGQSFEEHDGKIYIPENADTELIWNYTSKANDPVWMAEHVGR